MAKRMNRRTLLQYTGIAAAGVALSPFLQRMAQADVPSGPPKKVLFFTKSQTFQHPVIARPKDDPTKLSFAEQLLTDWGKENGFDVTCTKDGTMFDPDKIKDIDIFAFCTTGDLTKDSPEKTGIEPPMTPEGKQAFLDAIAGGKGYIGFHCASDTFHSPGHVQGQADLLRSVDESGKDKFDPYIQMLGGEFIIHGDQQTAILKCIDPNFPGAKAYTDAKFVEEWYSLKNFASDLHVILAQDCTGMKSSKGEYARGPYPETWIRVHEKGRVFYTSMGHRGDVWKRPEFKTLVVGALNWASGRIEADTTPNIATATPDANVKAG
jgi:hypothetical protein